MCAGEYARRALDPVAARLWSSWLSVSFLLITFSEPARLTPRFVLVLRLGYVTRI